MGCVPLRAALEWNCADWSSSVLAQRAVEDSPRLGSWHVWRASGWAGGWESCAHCGDQPGYPRREAEKEKARIESSVRAFDSQDSVERKVVRVSLEAAHEWNCDGLEVA